MSDPSKPLPDRAQQRGTFPSTRWSRILGGERERDLEQLAQTYWRPIRVWLGARLRCGADEAAEMAQEMFAWLLRTQFFERADPSRGRFRAFLKTALEHFVIEQARHKNAQKRGAGATHESLDAVTEPVDSSAATPDEVLDQEWRRDLLARARDALQSELESTGRATYFALFADSYLIDETPDRATLAERYGISKTDVSNWLDHSKRRYRALLRSIVGETVSDDETLAEELQWLFGQGEQS